MKRKIFALLLTLCMCLAFLPTTVFAGAPGTYHTGDIAAINSIIANNQPTGMTQAPSDGSESPEDWKNIVYWDYSATPKRVTSLNLTNKDLTGSLDVSGLTALTRLYCNNSNQLTALNVDGMTTLTWLECNSNQLTELNVSSLTNLTHLECGANQLTELDVNSLTNLTYLLCSANQLIELNVSSLTNLTHLACDDNQLTELNVNSLTNLAFLSCAVNQLTGTLDVSNLEALTRLVCAINRLTGIKLNSTATYQRIWVFGNRMTDSSAVTGQTIPWNEDEGSYVFEPQYFTITNILTNITNENSATHYYFDGLDDYTAKLTADGGYRLPEEIAVRVGEHKLTSGEDYTFNSTNGALVIFVRSIFGNIEIEANGVPEGVSGYSVSVQKEGHGTASATPTSGSAGTEITLSATPDSGWILKEWQIVPDDINISNNKFTMPNSNVVVKAVFVERPFGPSDPEEATVTFDPAGGKWEDGTTAPKTITTNVGDEIAILEAPVREGYEFKHWEGSAYQPGEKYQVPSGGHTFTAVWTKTVSTKPTDTSKDTKPGQALPATGENVGTYLWPSVLFLAAGGLLFVFRKKKSKQKG